MDSDLYFFFVKLLGGLSRLLFRIRYVGREHVPKDGKLILCCNHRSVIDPLFLAYPLRRQVFYICLLYTSIGGVFFEQIVLIT